MNRALSSRILRFDRKYPNHQHPLFYVGDDGRLVFLDFGLMSYVEDNIMESFATGIQACLAEDYTTLAEVFQAVGFVDSPLQYRDDESQKFRTEFR